MTANAIADQAAEIDRLLAVEAATCVFQTADRAWWLAGWHDSQMEKEITE